MKKFINKSIVAATFAAMIGLTSCEKDFLDVNVNPNTATTSTPELVLPSGMGAVAYTLGNQFQFIGNFWSQHWTQSYAASQYKAIDRYQITTSTGDRPWQYLYAGALNDFKYVSDQASEGDSSNYAAIADIMSAYTYQILVDGWNDVPFSEALQGSNNFNPKYDPAENVYKELIPMIDRGLAKIKTGPGTVVPGNDDLIFQGNMGRWRKFANTLKLKIYLRQWYADEAYARTGITQLYAGGAEFLGAGESAEFKFSDASNNRNPVFQTEFTFSSGVNVVASETIINYLQSTNDPRIDDFFDRATTAPNAGQHKGIPQGAAGEPGAPATPQTAFSKPDLVNIVGPAAAVPFISDAESFFLQAEAALYGLGTGNADALYAQGITASFTRWGRSAGLATFLAEPTISLAAATSTEEKLERIITQKWVSMSGRQGFEAWTELRRTGYPSFITPSLSSTLGAGQMPNRLVYVFSEQSRNPNTPALVLVQEKVWWDKRD